MRDNIYGLVFGTAWTVILGALFIGFVWLVFWLASVEPGWAHRPRPWIAIALLWITYGFGVRLLVGAITAGMLETPGWWALGSIALWPYTVFVVLAFS